MTASDVASARRKTTARRACAWMAAFACAGIALALLYPGSYQQDGGTHFLFARDSWWNHTLLVDVWGRPLFTALYALPALAGYLPAKLLTVALSVAAALQCWRWAEDEGMARAELAIPFFALQPSVILLASDTLTEPLFALVLVIALRLRRGGRVLPALIVASLLPLARPEGFFVCLLWGLWTLWDKRVSTVWWQRLRVLPLLLVGVAAWWIAALLITRDPAFILNNWPHNWAPTAAMYGTAPWLEYWRLRYEIVAYRFAWLFAIGFLVLLARRRIPMATSLVVMLFVLHSVLRHYGLFGSAGYPRYFVCVAPAIALITLAGWNVVVDVLWRALGSVPPAPRRWLRGVMYSAAACLFVLVSHDMLYYIDDHATARDAFAIRDAERWFRAHPAPVQQLIWSQAYMCILTRCDTRHRVYFSDDHAHNLALLEATPSRTLVFWDGETGPDWYGLHAVDFEASGFRRLFDRQYELEPRFKRRIWYWQQPWNRPQEMMLYYKGNDGASVETARPTPR